MTNPAIFRAYDIRGIYPEELNEVTARLIARSYADLMQEENPGKKLTIVVGMDMRLSGPQLKAEVVAGLLESGCDVLDIGLVSTPTFYFAVGHLGADGGLQVSASHNPGNWNGIKIVRRNAKPVTKESGIPWIRDRILEDRVSPPRAEHGSVKEISGTLSAEADAELTGIDLGGIRSFRIVADAANAMGALYLDEVFRRIPAEVTRLNFELDGSFPAHEANPANPANMAELRAAVTAEKADLGIATDGDGDRVFLVDERGNAIESHILAAILSEIELKEAPGAAIVHELRPGRIIRDVIAEGGGRAVIAPVGNPLIKEIMLRENAAFGSELSGHFFYRREFGTFEMPVILIAKFLRWLSEQGKPLSEAVSPYRRYAHSGEVNFHLPDRAAIDALIEKIKTVYSSGEQYFLDGVSVEYPTFWFNVRASNTEPVMRLTLEALDATVLEAELSKLKELIGSDRSS